MIYKNENQHLKKIKLMKTLNNYEEWNKLSEILIHLERSSRNEYDNWLDIAITEGRYTSNSSIQHELGQ